jgi:hypothetical protein
VGDGIGGGTVHRDRLGRILCEEDGNGYEYKCEKQRQSCAQGNPQRQ